MVWLLRSKALRKPAVLVGAACTSVLFGMVVFDRILTSQQHNLSHSLPSSSSPHSPHPPSHHSKHCSACINSSTHPSYRKLRKYESTRSFKNSGSVIKRVDVVFLGSNSPIEDRFVVGTSENLGGAFFSMIDGHKGTHCSQFLQDNMLQRVSSHLHEQSGLQDDLKIVLDMDTVDREALMRNSEQSPRVASRGESMDDAKNNALSAEKIKDGLHESLSRLDEEMSQAALAEVKLILSGHSFTEDMKKKVMAAVDGACALTAMVRQQDILVANTGDCRVVLGQRGSDGSFKPLPLSEDQNAMNTEEVERLKNAHPGEATSLIVGGRILGGLMPFRTFGDVDYKWERKYIQGVLPMVPNYKTPPYVTAEPVMTRHQLTKEDKFVILATDGFWERVSNQDAVDTVAGLLSRSRGRKRSLKALGGAASSIDESSPGSCCKGNAATELLWQALGGKEAVVSEMLRLDPGTSRMYRDDITIMVVYL